MIEVNRVQARFYDSISEVEDQQEGIGYARHKSANLLTRAWAALRYRQQNAARQSGIEKLKDDFHRKWIEDKRGGDFLEVGCFRGTIATFPLIQASGRYLGIELSSKAVAALQEKIRSAGLDGKASAQAMDFLNM